VTETAPFNLDNLAMTWSMLSPVLIIAVAAWLAWRRDFGMALILTASVLITFATSSVGALGALMVMIAGIVLKRRHLIRDLHAGENVGGFKQHKHVD
jgi:hypothetical protein